MFLSKSLLYTTLLFLCLSLSNTRSHFYTWFFFFYSQPPALFSVEKSFTNCVKAGHQRTHSLVRSRDNGPPAVSSMSPGLSALSDHSEAAAPSSISPTASDTISHYHPSADSTGRSGAPKSAGSEDRLCTAARGVQNHSQGAGPPKNGRCASARYTEMNERLVLMSDCVCNVSSRAY